MMATISTNFGDGMVDFDVTTWYRLSGTQAKNWIEHFGLNGVKVRIDIFVGVLKRAAPFFLIISFTVGRTQCCFKDEFT